MSNKSLIKDSSPIKKCVTINVGNITISKEQQKPIIDKPLLNGNNIIELPKIEIIPAEQIEIVIELLEKEQSTNCSTCDSIINDVNTGFGAENNVEIECPKPLYKVPLYKEKYLGEFEKESEKRLARENLNVYSILEIDEALNNIIQNNDNYVTKTYLLEKLDSLDFVKSTLKAYADYQIPDNIFKL